MNMMDAAALATLTRKENAMALFHLMGRVLYNKREFLGFLILISLFCLLETALVPEILSCSVGI